MSSCGLCIQAVSVSLPTWDDIVRYMEDDEELHKKLQSDYPRYETRPFEMGAACKISDLCRRFYQHAYVEKLNKAVLARVGASETTRCAIFPSKDAMRRCGQLLLRHQTDLPCSIQELSFALSHEAWTENATWACFSAVLFPEQFIEHVKIFWYSTGDGISSRHAQFCLERFPFMHSVSSDSSLQTSATRHDIAMVPSKPWGHSDPIIKENLKALIAKLVTSEKSGRKEVSPQDVFLYPKGMSAIGTVARSLVPASTHASEAVIFG